jgi:hypothetical protein
VVYLSKVFAFRGEAEEEWVTKKKVEITTTKEKTIFN